MQPGSGNTAHSDYLSALGIDVWRFRKHPNHAEQADNRSENGHTDDLLRRAAQSENATTAEKAAFRTSESDLASLDASVRVCTRCELHQGRIQTVFGVGDENAEWMFIGEAPGAEEDRQGLPFVGRAGQLLTHMLLALGLKREEVYIANVLKCRPPNNRDPMGEEVRQCEPYLLTQIEFIKPKIIVAMGRFSAQSLLKSNETIGRLRGRVHHYSQTRIPLIVTYHPAYLLRSPIDKAKSWQDLLLAKRTISG